MLVKLKKDGSVRNVVKKVNPNSQTSAELYVFLDQITGDRFLQSEIEPVTIDWEQRRYEVARAAVQGYCIALGIHEDSEMYEEIARASVRMADALLKELNG